MGGLSQALANSGLGAQALTKGNATYSHGVPAPFVHKQANPVELFLGC